MISTLVTHSLLLFLLRLLLRLILPLLLLLPPSLPPSSSRFLLCSPPVVEVLVPNPPVVEVLVLISTLVTYPPSRPPSAFLLALPALLSPVRMACSQCAPGTSMRGPTHSGATHIELEFASPYANISSSQVQHKFIPYLGSA